LFAAKKALLVGRVSHESHPLSDRAKDMGSAAVFLALIQLAACWSFIFVVVVFLLPGSVDGRRKNGARACRA